MIPQIACYSGMLYAICYMLYADADGGIGFWVSNMRSHPCCYPLSKRVSMGGDGAGLGGRSKESAWAGGSLAMLQPAVI